MTHQKVICVTVNKRGNGEDDFTKSDPVAVVVLGERHQTVQDLQSGENEMLSPAQRRWVWML